MRPQALAAVFGLAGSAAAQAVTSRITPTAAAPAGCTPAAAGTFEIAVVDVGQSGKRDPGAVQARTAEKRAACAGSGVLVATLADGVMMDAQGRTAYIASNYQFQFDGPPQAGAIYTAGFSVCGNDSLALGGSTTWYKCQSGDFYNLYDRSWAAQCSPAEIVVMPCGGGDAADGGGGAGQNVDATTVDTIAITTTIVSLLSDGQPQVITTTIPVPMCQIGDGQAQVHTTPCAFISGASSTGSSPAPASEFSDGQVQVTTSADVPAAATGGAGTSAPPAGDAGGTTLVTSLPAPGSAEAASTGSDGTSTGLSPTSAPTISQARVNAASLGLLALGLVCVAAYL